MVVCNTSMMPMAQAACPVPPSAMHHFPPGLCPLSPVSAISCNQRYPPTTILTSGQMLTTAATTLPCAQGISSPPMIRCNQTPSPQTTPNSTDSSDSSNLSYNGIASNCNTVLTYTPVPTNFVPITGSLTTILPYSQTSLISNKLPNNTSASNAVQCNQGLYSTCSQIVPTNAIVSCQQRIVNGQSVLHCTPGVCQITQAAVYPNGTVEMCPIPSSPVLQNNNATIYPVSPTMSITQNICTAASNWKQSYGMEQVWQCEFRSLFLQYAPHGWMLLPVNQKPSGIWHANVDSAKVRFCCEDCGHGWTSMKGRVAFWFILNPATNEGVVCLKLYGQQCDRCKTGNYEPAMWYPEEVVKVLVNIYNRVGQVYYGFTQAPYHKARRPGKPRTPHNSELCQACKDGVCAERR